MHIATIVNKIEWQILICGKKALFYLNMRSKTLSYKLINSADGTVQSIFFLYLTRKRKK